MSLRLASACTFAVAVLALAACGDDTGSPAGSTQSANADGYPVTVRNCGRTLTFDKSPGRAVLPYHPMAEIVVGLGLGDNAVGRVGYEGSLTEAPLLPEQAAAFKEIPVVSKNNFPPPKEQMLSLRPDFLLAYGDFDYGGKHEGAEGLATLKELERAGVQVYSVICPNKDPDLYGKESIAASYRAILDIGRIFGVSERAQKRVAEMKRQIADVSEAVSKEPAVKVISYGGGTGPISLAGEGIITEILQAAGAENVFADEKDFFEASLEEVAAKPVDEFVIFPDYEKATAKLDGDDEARFLFKTFPNMPASKNRRFAVTGYEYTSPGWRNAQAVEDLARQLHPNAFDEDGS